MKQKIFSLFIQVISFSILTSVFLASLSGCGKFGAPIPPEYVAPKAVEDLSAEVEGDSLKLSWSAPKVDRRGRELKSLDGYAIYAKSYSSEEEKAVADYKKLAVIEDRSIKNRDKKRAEVAKQGGVTRKVEADSELTGFSYVLTDIKKGRNYLVKIVPLNQGGIEGYVQSFVQVETGTGAAVVSMVNAQSYDSGEIYSEGNL